MRNSDLRNNSGNNYPSQTDTTAENKNKSTMPNTENNRESLPKQDVEKFRKGRIIGSILSFIPLPIFAINQLFLNKFISNMLLSLYFSNTLSMEDYKNISLLFSVIQSTLIYGFLIIAMILMIIYKTKNKSPSLPVTLSVIGVIVTFIGIIPVGCVFVLLAGFFQLVQKKEKNA